MEICMKFGVVRGRSILIALFFLSFPYSSGAQQDHHSPFIGYYQFKSFSDGKPGVMRIKLEGDSYLMNDGYGKIYPLEKTEDGFKIDDELMAISADKAILYFAGRELPRVTEEFANNLVLEQERDKKLCRELDEEAAKKSAETSDSAVWNKYVDELSKRKPEGCRLINDGKRRGFGTSGEDVPLWRLDP